MQQYREEAQNCPEIDFQEPAMEDSDTEENHRLRRKPDGSYTWTFDMELLHNPWYLPFLMKLILIPSGVIFVVILLLSLNSGVSPANLLMGYGIILGVLAFVAMIIWAVHLLIAKGMGNTQRMTFEMNEDGVTALVGTAPGVSAFRSVKTIRIDRTNHILFLNSWFLYNVICCRPEEFDFVCDYIVSRCPQALILGG